MTLHSNESLRYKMHIFKISISIEVTPCPIFKRGPRCLYLSPAGFVYCHGTSFMLDHICMQPVYFMCQKTQFLASFQQPQTADCGSLLIRMAFKCVLFVSLPVSQLSSFTGATCWFCLATQWWQGGWCHMERWRQCITHWLWLLVKPWRYKIIYLIYTGCEAVLEHFPSLISLWLIYNV